MKGNQFRLCFSALAYTMVEALRRLGLIGAVRAVVQVDTIRLKLVKIVAIVRVITRRVLLQLSQAYPWRISTRLPSTPYAVEPRRIARPPHHPPSSGSSHRRAARKCQCRRQSQSIERPKNLS
jgi:hypothetical protein